MVARYFKVFRYGTNHKDCEGYKTRKYRSFSIGAGTHNNVPDDIICGIGRLCFDQQPAVKTLLQIFP